ncbi:unnamed protein product [Discosporangium mesarthrocarpum]
MDVAVPSVFNKGQHAWYEPRGLFLETPTVSWRGGEFIVELPAELLLSSKQRGPHAQQQPELRLGSREAAFDFSARDPGELAKVYRRFITSEMDRYEKNSSQVLGSLLVEPLVMGAGGMIFVDPLFQRVLVQECRGRGIPVIYDEVFCGLWRLGVSSTRELLGEDPDVGCYAKLLTGGLVPMSVTLASEQVFESFSGTKAESLLHGHSYTANPVGCAAALEYFSQLEKNDNYPGHGGRMADMWDESSVSSLSKLPTVERAFSLGSLLVVEVKAQDRGYDSKAAQKAVDMLRKCGLYARVLGNVTYIMASPLSHPEIYPGMFDILRQVLAGQEGTVASTGGIL